MQKSTAHIFLALVFYILMTPSIYAQGNASFFEKIGIKNGLSSSYPTSIIQDSKGFIWIGTNNGLNKYDGYQSKIYTYDANNNNSISDNWITSLLEDSYGNIWIGTDGGGLNLYNTTTGDITRFKHQGDTPNSISSDVILSIYEDNQNRLWVGTKNGLNLLDRSKLNFQHWKQPNTCEKCTYSVNSIYADDKNNLWIGDEYYGLYYFNTLNGEFTKPHLKYANKNKLPSKFINDLYFSKGNLWVGTDTGLVLLNTVKETSEKISIQPPSDKQIIEDVFIMKIYSDNHGGLWFGTKGNGLAHYTLETNQMNWYKSNGDSDYKIGSNTIEDILLDKSKNVWIATRGSGLNKFNLSHLKFKQWKNDEINSLVHNNVRALLQDLDGTVWIGTNHGLSRYSPKTKTFKNYITDFDYKADIKNPRIRSIFRSKNNVLWIGTQNGGLYQYDEKKDRFILANDYANSLEARTTRHLASIYEPEEGKLLLGTAGTGFISYNTLTGTFKHLYPKDAPNSILLSLNVKCVLKASDSEIWVGSNRGLLLLNINTLKFKQWKYEEGCENCLPGNKIRSLFKDQNNNLWIGTRSGLALFNPITESFTNFDINDGLPSNIIFGILPGSDDHIWLTTPNGLSRVNPNNFQFKNITIPENNILDLGGHSEGLNGNLLVGGTGGLTIFNPKDIKPNLHIPEVVFTDIKVDNQSMAFDKNISEIQSIDLRHDQNNLTFEFSALEFTNSQINKYKYKLEGFNDHWVEYGNKHDLTFTNLDPNTYVLKIKGSNNEGLWNEKKRSLTINISPPWWKTLWFKILSFLVIIGSIFSIYYLRISSLKSTEKRLKKEVAKQTKELLKNNKKLERLHKEKDGIIGIIAHDLRGPLNNIHGLIYLLEDNGNLDDEQKTYTKYINESVANGNSLINDLLFMSNINLPEKRIKPEIFDLSECINEWEKSYVTRLANKNQILQKHIGNGLLRINTDRKSLTRIFDNLMTNAIKFSDKGSVIDLSINPVDDRVIISFKDNGPGMSKNDQKMAFKMFQKLSAQPTDGESSHGLGLAIVKTLVEKLNGTIKIESTMGEGTTFIITLPKEISKDVN
ncbi:GHKL domain-containing protein [Tamlana haliotis]|uniref:histidine kinase n=1 Tax=Pseudotamlana haliotis TaxID=2614804 RepID=A0A6N6MM44_9FLAO|nr:sensor histidine kinase [Tamlana haliotis]KAB1070902.1 GHKL domain-containing protein [Tamlana haliotis]